MEIPGTPMFSERNGAFREYREYRKVFLDIMFSACYNTTRSDERHLIERAFSSVGQSLRLITG